MTLRPRPAFALGLDVSAISWCGAFVPLVDKGKGLGWAFTVPTGIVFDPSTPRPLWWVFYPDDRRFLKAVSLHDELLLAGIDRVTAAGAFNEALRADGVSAALRLDTTAAVAFCHWV